VEIAIAFLTFQLDFIKAWYPLHRMDFAEIRGNGRLAKHHQAICNRLRQGQKHRWYKLQQRNQR
jgi:hypothetical protein